MNPGPPARRLPEDELEETFARSSGPGGQHVNKVSTAVTLRHRPSGLSVTVQDSRSQMRNRQLARERLFAAAVATKRGGASTETRRGRTEATPQLSPTAAPEEKNSRVETKTFAAKKTARKS